MKTNFDPEYAGALEASVEFRFPHVVHHAKVSGGRIEVGVGGLDEPDIVVKASPDALKPVLYGGAPAETLDYEGDPDLAVRFFSSFSLPPKVGASPVEA